MSKSVLKNFSLLYEADGTIRLSPAYDLLPTKLILPQDREETALTLNGKKNQLRRDDFDAFGQSLTLTDRQITNTHVRLQRNLAEALDEVPMSFISTEQQEKFTGLIEDRMARIWG